MTQPRILVVDDDAAHRRMLEAVLTEEGYRLVSVEDGDEAVAAVADRFYDLVLMDVRMARMDGLTAQAEIHRRSPGIPIIVMTAYASVGTAVEALKAGAYDYLTKPLDVEELKLLVEKALRHRRLEDENRNLRERLADRSGFDRIVGRSPAMRKVFETASLVAPSDATVLILGESGTGKGLIAEAIHENSERRERPFVPVNCAALPETLLESELFGHERGAFTGAAAKKPGRFRQAHTGTMFLDEIGELAPATQAKLLRVLQEQRFEPLGAAATVTVDVRIIAATNRDLEAEIAAGRFREDLFYRLNVVTVEMPPLRDRPEDILPLADRFLAGFAEKNKRRMTGFTPRAADLLMRYDWPGNVRELENAVERAVILARGERIVPEDLPDAVRAADPEPAPEGGELNPASDAPPVGRSLKEMERQMILQTLEEVEGNRTRAAEILGISRRTLQNKLKVYGINE